jgi:hypothetical protein
MGERLRLGVDSEPFPLRLSESSAAQELACLLDTRPSEPAAWLERMRACVAATFASSPAILKAAQHGLDGAEIWLEAPEAAKRDLELAKLDELLFAMCVACAAQRAEPP